MGKGIVYMDFPGERLLAEIINANFSSELYYVPKQEAIKMQLELSRSEEKQPWQQWQPPAESETLRPSEDSSGEAKRRVSLVFADEITDGGAKQVVVFDDVTLGSVLAGLGFEPTRIDALRYASGEQNVALQAHVREVIGDEAQSLRTFRVALQPLVGQKVHNDLILFAYLPGQFGSESSTQQYALSLAQLIWEHSSGRLVLGANQAREVQGIYFENVDIFRQQLWDLLENYLQPDDRRLKAIHHHLVANAPSHHYILIIEF